MSCAIKIGTFLIIISSFVISFVKTILKHNIIFYFKNAQFYF